MTGLLYTTEFPFFSFRFLGVRSFAPSRLFVVFIAGMGVRRAQ